MIFEEFRDAVIDNIRDYLPEEYRDAEIRTLEVNKINSGYTGLVVSKDDSVINPTLNLDQLYAESTLGHSFEELMTKAAQILQERPDPMIDTDFLKDYSRIKDRLFIRISDAQANSKILENVPHKVEMGLAMTYHIQITFDDQGMGSAVVTNSLLESYGISQEQLHADALENSQKTLPAFIAPLEDVMGQLMGMDSGPDRSMTFEQALEAIPPEENQMLMLSNSRSVNGSAVIFYPDVMRKIGEHFQVNFYILPSSTHEVLLVADNINMDVRNLQEMVRQINRDVVDPHDRLSDDVFHYDSKEHVLEKAEDYERRIGRDMEQTDAAKAVPKAKGHKRDDWVR